MTKYKYYFRKPKSEIIKDIFRWLVVAGAISIAATSPYFLLNILKSFKKGKKYKRKKVYDAFYRLRKKGYINIEKRNHKIYISLTEEGRKKAGWLQINDLEIKKPKKWDRKWRIVIFDIACLRNFYRRVFREKLKELGFFQLQKSVWIYPFGCKDEIELLRDFFGLKEKEVRLIVSKDIGNDVWLKNKFNLK